MPHNNTDYDLPEMWGRMTAKQRSDWLIRERVFRQAIRQNTAFGRAYSQQKEEEERTDTDQFRPDGDLE